MLKCQSETCEKTQPLPEHCGQPMHIEEVDGKNMLVCWMGPSCGKQVIPEHCEQPMIVVEDDEVTAKSEHVDVSKVDGDSYLVCIKCREKQPVPMHCGQPMHIKEVDGNLQLVCWMGPSCGKQDIPEHCGQPMNLPSQQIKKEMMPLEGEGNVESVVKQEEVSENLEKTTLAITGMHCANCVQTVEKGLEQDGIVKASVNLISERVVVEYDSSKLSVNDIVKHVEKTGYGARELEKSPVSADGEATLLIGGMHCANCVQTVEKALKVVDGVSDASVNLTTEKASVKFDPNEVSIGDIITAVEKSGYRAMLYDPESGVDQEKVLREREIKIQRFRLGLSVLLALPALVIAMTHDFLPGLLPAIFMEEITLFPPFHDIIVLHIILLVLATPVQFVAGWTFYSGSYRSLKNKSTNMDVLIALGTSAAYFFSIATTFFIEGPVFYETAAVLIMFVLVGKYLEANAKGRTSEAIKTLMNLQPSKATLLKDGEELVIPVDMVKTGDLILIKPGEKIPVDGTVIKGYSAIDESMITGESIPVDKQLGDEIIGATINKTGLMHIEATKVGKDTMLSRIIKLVEDAQASKAPIQRFADIISGYFVPAVVIIAVFTFLGWMFLFTTNLLDPTIPLQRTGRDPFLFSFLLMISVLVIACPCALGLATPTAIMVGTGKGAETGILFKSGGALEVTHNLHSIIFDKTGTLTKGKPEVTDIVTLSDHQEEMILQLAASIEKGSEHPLGESIVEAAKSKKLEMLPFDDFEAIPGHGIKAKIKGYELLIGNRKLMNANKIDFEMQIEEQIQGLENQGKTAVIVASDNKVIAIIAIADTLKDNSVEAVRILQKMGIETWMITGDNERTARAIGKQVGMNNIMAGVLPENKAAKVKELQEKGKIVAMVGDGINDAPALAQANIGIALGGGTDVAIETGDIVLVKNDLLDVVKAIKISKKTISKIKQNFFWALGYNVTGLPVAAGLLFLPFNILLVPIIASIAMALSSVSVVSNSLLLKRYNP
jgi:Cu+-exporting ATPase